MWQFEKIEQLEDFRAAMRKKSPIIYFSAYPVKNELRISVEWEDETEAIFVLKKEDEQ